MTCCWSNFILCSSVRVCSVRWLTLMDVPHQISKPIKIKHQSPKTHTSPPYCGRSQLPPGDSVLWRLSVSQQRVLSPTITLSLGLLFPWEIPPEPSLIHGPLSDRRPGKTGVGPQGLPASGALCLRKKNTYKNTSTCKNTYKNTCVHNIIVII